MRGLVAGRVLIGGQQAGLLLPRSPHNSRHAFWCVAGEQAVEGPGRAQIVSDNLDNSLAGEGNVQGERRDTVG